MRSDPEKYLAHWLDPRDSGGMTFHNSYREVLLDPTDTDRIWNIDTWAFPNTASPEQIKAYPLDLEAGRTWGVVPNDAPDDADLVAIHGSYAQADFTVPGNTVSSSGLTWVGVHPGHRRRGILSAMIANHFNRSRERGEIISTLFAAEMGIYGRFGFGMAADELGLSLSRGADLRKVDSSDKFDIRLETASEEQHDGLVQTVLQQAASAPYGLGVNRPGSFSYSTASHRARWWFDCQSLRDGYERWRIAIVERNGQPEAFALFRRNADWDHTGPHSKVTVMAPVTLSVAAARALWSVLLDLDLTEQVNVHRMAVDDPLPGLLANRRGAAPRIGDNVWVRILDVRQALAARQYQSAVDAVIEVKDERFPDNAKRWHLVAGAFDTAEVSETGAAPDVTVDIATLSAAYLGGVSLASLATGGRVTTASADKLAVLSTAFGWPLAPLSPMVF
ncbi:Predicted acetyltransferase [Micrococcales bacterium KH10]|nr:Predicted acetyltransferase [Micrococcales bacterium KH10]